MICNTLGFQLRAPSLHLDDSRIDTHVCYKLRWGSYYLTWVLAHGAEVPGWHDVYDAYTSKVRIHELHPCDYLKDAWTLEGMLEDSSLLYTSNVNLCSQYHSPGLHLVDEVDTLWSSVWVTWEYLYFHGQAERPPRTLHLPKLLSPLLAKKASC
jgi:hypothetical protein